MERADVVVVGAGLIGSAIAWRLAQAGRKVTLLDRGEPGAEASTAAVGGLQPEAGREASQPLLDLWLTSLAGYGDFVGELRETTGAAFEYRVCGRLNVALDDKQDEALRAAVKAQGAAGIACDYLTGDEARRLEPALTPTARSALYFPTHALVDNQRMSPVVATAAALAGVDVRPHEPILAIASSGGRIDGVQTSRAQIAADVVVNAAGSWAAGLVPTVTQYRKSASLRDLAGDEQTRQPIVRPMKGEVIALQTPTRRFERIITVAGGSLSPRADGRVIVGGTVVEAGFDKVLTAGGVAELIAAAVTAVPALQSARFLDAWTGLRPRTPDDQPIIGEDRIAGLFWATGHFKTGILAAPATADAVRCLIEGRQPTFAVEALSPRRFER